MIAFARFVRAGRAGLVVSMGLAALGIGGCLVNGHSREDVSGTYVGRGTLSQIEPGQTTQDWVIATLGEPTSKQTLGDGGELWKWSYARTKRGSGTVLFLLSTSSEKETACRTFVEFGTDGVVRRAWQDESERR